MFSVLFIPFERLFFMFHSIKWEFSLFCLNFDNSFVPGFIVSSSELWRASAVNTRTLVAFAVLER